MKALSIRNPWAASILFLGKDVENRTWPTAYRGPVLIHVPKTLDRDAWANFWMERFGGPPCSRTELKEMQVTGGIIGQVDIIDCVTSSKSKWFVGPYGFVLANPRPLVFRACPGKLGFFTPNFPE